TFAERDAAGRIAGFTCRYPDDAKLTYPGGSRGLFIPRCLDTTQGPILFVEGASCTIAATAMGLPAVGRPSSHAGTAEIAALLRRLGRDAIILGEYDPKPDGKWPGREGAMHVAAKVQALLGSPVSWALPPGQAKDLRA